jgi:hypothetical protein
MFDASMGIDQAKAIATYVVAKAKDKVNGCGGFTEMVAIKSDGVVENTAVQEAEDLEECLRRIVVPGFQTKQ